MEKNISIETIYEIAKKVAENPISKSEAKDYSLMLESIQKSISSLRNLNIKDIEPSIIYVPFLEQEDE